MERSPPCAWVVEYPAGYAVSGMYQASSSHSKPPSTIRSVQPGVGLTVSEGEGDGVPVGMSVGVGRSLAVGEGVVVFVGDMLGDGVGVLVALGVAVADAVAEAVRLGVGVGVAVAKRVGLSVGVGIAPQIGAATSSTYIAVTPFCPSLNTPK
jgi:hypothetical protein